MCSALTYSVLQCPGVMPGFTGDGAWAHSAAYASTDEISSGPTMEHGTPVSAEFDNSPLVISHLKHGIVYPLKIRPSLHSKHSGNTLKLTYSVKLRILTTILTQQLPAPQIQLQSGHYAPYKCLYYYSFPPQTSSWVPRQVNVSTR